jgi:hypothetical protein
MDLSRLTRLCAAAALSAFSAVTAQGDDCIDPVVLGEKPAMSAYGDYSDFLVAAMEHKSKEEKKRKHQKMCPELYREAPLLDAPNENLDNAVRQSAQRPPFDYGSHQSWYNRSTSQSFGLPGLPNASMSGEAINTSLIALDAGPIEDQLRSILLALQSPLAGIRDGGNASSLIGRQFFDVLLKRESEVLQAFLFDTFGARLTGISYSDDGRLTLYLSQSGVMQTQGVAYFASCLSSCGEFGLIVDMR